MKTDEMGEFVLRGKITSEGKECHEEGLQEKITWVNPSKQQTVAHKRDKEMCWLGLTLHRAEESTNTTECVGAIRADEQSGLCIVMRCMETGGELRETPGEGRPGR